MNNYYVYEYIRLDTNEVFYIGKGKGTRFKQLSNRNKHFTNIVNSIPYKVIKILEDLSNMDACEAEISFISYRKSIGQASCNFTAGGEGTAGLSPWNKGIKQTQEFCQKNREAQLKIGQKGEKHPMFGRKQSEESRKRMSAGKMGKPWSEARRAAQLARKVG